tara:strand:- start:494 stop:1267 length:774 start_codon:yes stop_codon:yes gene_type:complete
MNGYAQPLLQCWLPELNYGKQQTLKNGRRWVALMLTVKELSKVPFDVNFTSEEFYSQKSLIAFNSGSASPWKTGEVSCSQIDPEKAKKWAVLITDGQKHKAFDVCYGQFTHFVSHPYRSSAAEQGKGRLTRYCSHGAVDKGEWRALLLVYFNVNEYMFDSRLGSRRMKTTDSIYQRREIIETLESRRALMSKEYSTYYNVLKVDAQQTMYNVMRKSAIDCQIFSQFTQDIQPKDCLYRSNSMSKYRSLIQNLFEHIR